MNRRQFLSGATLTVPSLSLASQSKAEGNSRLSPAKRKRRTIYFNDARHYYLYAFEPPMSLEDAWRPIDEVAGTSINTFSYGVDSGGLFSDTKVGLRWGADRRPFRLGYAWRALEQYAESDRSRSGPFAGADRPSP